MKGDWDKSGFLDSPHVDNLMDAVVGLGAEFWAMRQRMMALEKLIEDKGVLTRSAIESYRFTGEEKAASDAERNDFIARVFNVLTREATPVTGALPTARVKPRA